MSDEPQDVTNEWYSEDWVRHATDAEIIAELWHAVQCARGFNEPEVIGLEAGIVELFCEAVRRELSIPGLNPEPMLPGVALRRATRAIELQDVPMALRAIPHLNGGGLWMVYRNRHRLPPVSGHAAVWLEMIAYQIEWRLFSHHVARERAEIRRRATMSAEDYIALLELTVQELFGQVQMRMPVRPETHEEE